MPAYPDAALCVALSGGLDSVVLLASAHSLTLQHPQLRLRAVHVDHGLQAASRDWSLSCRERCQRLQLPLQLIELHLDPARGLSVESEARQQRYAALAGSLAAGECLLTAHHADDQLETVLLQLLRGAGVAGLAAMPASSPLGAGLHLRPLLELQRTDLLAYARAHQLDWIEDPMNTHSRYDRAYLRQALLPLLRSRWPAAARTIGRSTGHLAAAQRLLETLARSDAAPLLDRQGRLETAGLAALDADRQVNLLRWWIVERGLGLPSTARLRSVLDDVVAARVDAQPVVTWPGGEVRRYRGRLHAMAPLGPLPPAGWERSIRPGEAIELPQSLGTVSLERVNEGGILLKRLQSSPTLRFCSPGQRLRPAGRHEPHTLKNLFQEAGILPWIRPRLPLIHDGPTLVAVADLWTAADYAAGPGETGAGVTWRGAPEIR